MIKMQDKKHRKRSQGQTYKGKTNQQAQREIDEATAYNRGENAAILLFAIPILKGKHI